MFTEKHKYNFRFSREEAEVMLEVLEYWKESFTYGLEKLYFCHTWQEMNSLGSNLKTTDYLIKKITKQVNTKKTVLNFMIGDNPRRHLTVCLSSGTRKTQEHKEIQQNFDILKELIIRLRELSSLENYLKGI